MQPRPLILSSSASRTTNSTSTTGTGTTRCRVKASRVLCLLLVLVIALVTYSTMVFHSHISKKQKEQWTQQNTSPMLKKTSKKQIIDIDIDSTDQHAKKQPITQVVSLQSSDQKESLIPGETWKIMHLNFGPPTLITTSTTATATNTGSDNNKRSIIQQQQLDADTAQKRKVIMEPVLGQHRDNVDAVFAFAQGYPLNAFCGFVGSLLETGYEGDIVLSVSSLDKLAEGVRDYLEFLVHDKDNNNNGVKANLVVYAVDWQCFKKGNHSESGRVPNPAAEHDCQIMGLYGDSDTGAVLDDPRIPRPLATARFELYWTWSLHYLSSSSTNHTPPNHNHNHNHILLMDFRDAYFQRNPFEGFHTDRNTRTSSSSNANALFFYQEHDEKHIKDSSFNMRWLRTAYGANVANDMKDNAIICSGSTIGTPAAIELYLRAMVAQFDTTLCLAKGCDQGFHNYLAHHYTGEMTDTSPNADSNANEGAVDLVLVQQGWGAINNLGILRDKPLTEWGLYDAKQQIVLNWDKTTVSPIVHQFDRDDELKIYMRQRFRYFVQQYQTQKKQQ
jgi:hypothetical protein